jgi:pimeloyl-ACP methyl ester carboxylesterase
VSGTPGASADIVTRVIDVAGSPVHLRDVAGADRADPAAPAVLLLHGSGPGTTGWGSWEGLASALCGRHRVIVPDQAGFGHTPVPAGTRGGRAIWTAQAAGVMAALGIERYAVLGHSMGAAVALSLAAGRPDAVTAVVAVGAMGAQMPLTPALDAMWATGPGRESAREMLGLLYLDPSFVTESAVDARDAAIRAGEAEFAVLFPPPRERWARDLSLSAEELAQVRAPVLLVQGAQDRLTPLHEAALPLLAQLPDVRLHVFGRCGHVPAVEHREEFRRLVAGFLAAF